VPGKKRNIQHLKAPLAVDDFTHRALAFVNQMATWSRTLQAVIIQGRNRKEALQWLNLKSPLLMPSPFWRTPAWGEE
jgi:hypothetical protein